MPKIWWRESKQAYYLQIDRGTQKRLGRTRAEADAAYRVWLLEQGGDLPAPEKKKLTVAEVAQEFLDHCQAHTKPKSYEFYRYFVVPLVGRFGGAAARTLSPLSFTKWLDEHRGWKGSRRCAVVAVKRMFSWAVENKLLDHNPLAAVRRPPKKKRTRVLSAEERAYVLGAIRDEQFREYVFALLDTGCRPSEVAAVTANHVTRDGARWVFEEHKTDRTGEVRVVYLSPAVQELTRKLAALYPDGPLFRSTRKFGGVRRPWTPNGVRCRFKRLREKVAALRDREADPEERAKIPDLSGITAYVTRHTFATDALTGGMPVAVVAALLGHRSIKMVDEAYNHTQKATGLGVINLYIVPQNAHLAGACARETRQNADHGGFARSIGAEQTKKLTLFDIKTDAVKCEKSATLGSA